MKPKILKAIKDAGGKITLFELRRQIIGSVENFKQHGFFNAISEMCSNGVIDYRPNGGDLIYFVTPYGWEVANAER